MNLSELICQGESETLGFKRSLALKDEIGIMISAFFNTEGGIGPDWLMDGEDSIEVDEISVR
jgi:hypothetical protein